MKNILILFIISTIYSGLVFAELSHGSFELVNKKRISRTDFEFEFRVPITNNGNAIQAGSAAVSSTSPDTIVTEGNIFLGAILAGETIISEDTFTIQHNRKVPFDPGALVFEFTISQANQPPTANAGENQSVQPGTQVQLSAVGSSDPEGANLSYRWNLIVLPEGSLAELTDPTGATPSLIADVTGIYQIELIVNDGVQDSLTALIEINSYIFPEVVDFAFVEYRGREGHGGTFDIFGKPVVGDGQLSVSTFGDVAQLDIRVVTNTSSESYLVSGPSVSFDDALDWFAEIIIPSVPFTLKFAMHARDGKIYEFQSDVIKAQNTSMQLIKSTHAFYPGDQTVDVKINNLGPSSEFMLEVTDSKQYLTNPFIAASISIESNEAKTISVPIQIPEIELMHSLVITAKVSDPNQSAAIINQADLEVLVVTAPLVLLDEQKKVVVNPETCGVLERTQTDVQFALVGMRYIDMDTIDYSSINIDGELFPISVQPVDTFSSSKSTCSENLPDGKTDLITTFNLQDFLLANDDLADFSSIPLVIYFFSTDGRKFFLELSLDFTQSELP